MMEDIMASVSVRIVWNSQSKTNGQVKHDLRVNPPDYVDRGKTKENSIIIEPKSGKDLYELCKHYREKRISKRALKQNINVSIAGIVTFSTDAVKIIDSLDKEKQKEIFTAAVNKIGERYNTDVTGLTVHRDETSVHAHFQLCAYDRNGYPLSNTVKLGDFNKLQDLVAEAFTELGISRGVPKKERIAAGDNLAKTIHRSVHELHNDLPAELEEKKQEIAKAGEELSKKKEEIAKTDNEIEEQKAKLQKYQDLIAQNEIKLNDDNDKIDKIEKRLKTYEKRESDTIAKISELESKKTNLETEIQKLKSEYDKYNEIINTENPPQPPQTRIIKEEVGFFKNLEREIIEPAEFIAYQKETIMWASKKFSKENQKRKEELDLREDALDKKDAALKEKEIEINKKILADAKFKKSLKEQDKTINAAAVKIMNIAGIVSKNGIKQETAIYILRNFVDGGIAAVREFLLNLKNKNKIKKGFQKGR